MPAPFRLYNTLTRSVEDFTPLVPGEVSMYVCGMTVYDEAHVGHARAMVVFDVVARYLRSRDWKVSFVRNFTDVDDKIIARAAERDEAPLALAERFIAAFQRDAAGLGLETPTVEPRVSNSMDAILDLIGQLVSRGHAYAAAGSVWFDVASFPEYGKLSGQRVDDLRASPDLGDKRASVDFALWKAAKEGEPSWDSPWGPGRPGWHIECSAMARAHLGDTIDIHGGGLDLVFPHHENEVAQSECGTGHPFARYWMHNGMLVVGTGAKLGEKTKKMGKSEGNAFNISDLLERYPAEAIRLYYLQTHYRSPLPWNSEALPDALAMLARLYEAREVAEAMGGSEAADAVADALGPDARTVLELGRGFSERFHAAMCDDFNSAKALGHAFELARAINRFANHKKARKRGAPVVAPALAAMGVISSGLGLLTLSSAAFQDEVKDKRLGLLGLTRQDVETKIANRIAARGAKDWAQADALRDELAGAGILLMDRADGCDWRIRL